MDDLASPHTRGWMSTVTGRACAEPASRPSAPRSEAMRLDAGEHTLTLLA